MTRRFISSRSRCRAGGHVERRVKGGVFTGYSKIRLAATHQIVSKSSASWSRLCTLMHVGRAIAAVTYAGSPESRDVLMGAVCEMDESILSCFNLSGSWSAHTTECAASVVVFPSPEDQGTVSDQRSGVVVDRGFDQDSPAGRSITAEIL